MTAAPAQARQAPPARFWTDVQLAARLGRSVGWFRANRDALMAAGMPDRDGLTGLTDSHAVERWLDRRAGLDHGDDGARLTRRLDAWRETG